ncbi:MAG: hypothetical protein ABII98_01465 [bacterium]
MKGVQTPFILSKFFFPVLILAVLGIFFVFSFFIFIILKDAHFNDVSNRAEIIATAISEDIDAKKHESIQQAGDERNEIYKSIKTLFKTVIEFNPQINSTWILTSNATNI